MKKSNICHCIIFGLVLFPKLSLANPSYSKTIVHVVDQDNQPVLDAKVNASYGCKTFNPVDSAGWEEDAAFSGTTDGNGSAELKDFRSSKFRIMSSCHKLIKVYKYGYANHDSGHSFSSYSKLDSCLRKLSQGQKEMRSAYESFSSCNAGGKLATDEIEIRIKLYKLKSCDEIKLGIPVTQDRQALARHMETLTFCAPSYKISERQVFYPLLRTILSETPASFKQPLFEDQAIYESALKTLGFLCDSDPERISLLERWIHWSMEASKSKDAGWGPISLAREAAISLAFYNHPKATSVLENYLTFEEKDFYERYPHLKELSQGFAPWKLPLTVDKTRNEICRRSESLPKEYFEKDWYRVK